MQKAIMISMDQYDRMVASYDEAMAELTKLRKQISELSEQTVDRRTDRARGSTFQAG